MYGYICINIYTHIHIHTYIHTLCLELRAASVYGSLCVKMKTITVLETEAENIGNSLNNHRVRPCGVQDSHPILIVTNLRKLLHLLVHLRQG